MAEFLKIDILNGLNLLQELIENNAEHRKTKNESEMNTTNIRNLKLARPSNVINVNNVSNQFTLKSNHSATFPSGLVEFFVKSFSNDEDLILDCFAGSGTVGVVCEKLNRNYILIDKEEINIPTIKKKVRNRNL